MAFSAPFQPEALNVDQQREKMAVYMNDIRRRAFRLAAELMERDGQLIIAERVQRDADLSEQALMQSSVNHLRGRIGDDYKLWDVEGIAVSQGDNTGIETPLEWMARDESGKIHNSTEKTLQGDVGITILELRRNSRKIEKPI